MNFRIHIIFILIHTMVVIPGCKDRAASELQSNSNKNRKIVSYKDSNEYKKLKADSVHGVVDQAFNVAGDAVKKQKLQLIRVSPSGGRQIATGGVSEYWEGRYPNHKFYFMDNMQQPLIVLSVKAKHVRGETLVLELIEHNPSTFEVENYEPLFIELKNRNKKTVGQNIGSVKRSLLHFSSSLLGGVSDTVRNEEEMRERKLSPETVQKLITGAVIAVVSAAIGFVIAASLKKQMEGKMSWGIVAGTAIVGVAIFMLFLYSDFEDEEFDLIEPSDPKPVDVEEINLEISDRTWEFIGYSR